MLIDGPFRLGVVDNEETMVRELHLSFAPEFQSSPVTEQVSRMRSYIDELGGAVAKLDANDSNRQGMLMIQQIAEELLPHILAEELALNETIVVEIRPDLSFAGLLNSP
jgi:hypothetical protein